MERRETRPGPVTAPRAVRGANRAAASKGEKGSGGKGQKGKGGSGRKGDQSGGNEKGGGKGKGDESESKRDEESSDRQGGGDQDENQEPKGDNGRSSGSSSQLGGALEKIAGAVKWIVFAIIAVAVVLAVVLGILRYLAPFTNWAQRLLDAIRNWWAGLFGQKKAARAQEEPTATLAGLQRPPPFHEYSNPFVDGSAERRDPAELVAYTFEALDAWAWDRDRGRHLPETPLEFLARLADDYPDLVEVFTSFAKIYARVTYSQAEPPSNTLPACGALWDGIVHGVAVEV